MSKNKKQFQLFVYSDATHSLSVAGNDVNGLDIEVVAESMM
jgi:hypothetical protein